MRRQRDRKTGKWLKKPARRTRGRGPSIHNRKAGPGRIARHKRGKSGIKAARFLQQQPVSGRNA